MFHPTFQTDTPGRIRRQRIRPTDCTLHNASIVGLFPTRRGQWRGSVGPQFGHQLNLDRDIERQFRQTDRTARVSSRVAEHFDQEI